jgi:hypothetical protein
VGTAINLANTSVTPGTYGNGTHVPVYTVNQQGQLTSSTTTPLQAAGSNLTVQYNNNNQFNGTSNFTYNPTTGNMSVVGNVIATKFYGDGGFLSNISSYSNSNVANYLPVYGGNITARNITATGNITIDGEILHEGNLVVDGGLNITGNLIANSNVFLHNILPSTGNTGINIRGSGANGTIFLAPSGTGLVDVGNAQIGNVAQIPSTASSATSKYYVDLVGQGIKPKFPCEYATTINLSATYNNGTAGVGATLTATANGVLSVDGRNPSVGNRILVDSQTSTLQNGIYVVTNAGSASTPWILTRATDADEVNDLPDGTFVFVDNGTTKADTGWVLITDITAIGVSPQVWHQIAQAASYIGGVGINVVGTAINLANTSVVPGTYGNGTHVPVYTVNQQGQLTSSTTTPLQAGGSNLTVQFNNNNQFNGTSNFTFNPVSSNLTLIGNLLATKLYGNGSQLFGISWTGITEKPTTIAGFGITDAVTTNTTQTITGGKTFTGPVTLDNMINTIAGGITSPAYNFHKYDSIYQVSAGQAITVAIQDLTQPSKFKSVALFQPTGNFVIYGSGAFKPGGGAWSDSSDARLKTEVEQLNGSLEKLKQLNPVTFKWKYDNPNSPGVGFIAQNVSAVLPGAVSESEPNDEQSPFIPEGEKVLNIGWKNDIFAYLVGAIKELSDKVDELTTEINILKNGK